MYLETSHHSHSYFDRHNVLGWYPNSSKSSWYSCCSCWSWSGCSWSTKLSTSWLLGPPAWVWVCGSSCACSASPVSASSRATSAESVSMCST